MRVVALLGCSAGRRSDECKGLSGQKGASSIEGLVVSQEVRSLQLSRMLWRACDGLLEKCYPCWRSGTGLPCTSVYVELVTKSCMVFHCEVLVNRGAAHYELINLASRCVSINNRCT